MTHCYMQPHGSLHVSNKYPCYQLQATTNTSGVPGKHMKVVS